MGELINRTLVIYGPTATGKTALALQLARNLDGEIISADSRQVYRGLDIGTGKVGFESKIEKHNGFWIVDGVKIRSFDLVEPGQQFTVSDFLKFTNNSMIQIIELNKLPIIVGGTGFYIKALIDGVESVGVPSDPKLRSQLEKLTVSQLYQKLTEINSKRAESMNDSDRLNPRRLIRAIEISKASNKISNSNSANNTKYLIIGLTAPNTYLFEKAEKSFENRLKDGMIEEIKTLLSKGVSSSWLDSIGLEYRWLTKLALGQISKEEALKQSKGALHSFIRRQKTWFKQFKNINVYDISSPSWEDQLEKKVELWYTKSEDVRS